MQLDWAEGPTVNAVIVDCAEHLPFNCYVGEVASRVVRVSTIGPGGRTASLEQSE